ncbi:MAG: hypothetical protein AABY03_00925 [Nanoarchaeota archaeon]
MSHDDEMKLLIKIVLNFLLVLALFGVYETSKGIFSPNPFIMELFIIGIFLLSAAFLSLKNPDSRFLKITAYILTLFGIIFALNFSINRYVESINIGKMGEGGCCNN